MENNLGNIFVQQRCSDKLETVAPSTEETNSSANNSNYGESVMATHHRNERLHAKIWLKKNPQPLQAVTE